MANPTTAEEWKQVAADASAQIKELTAQQAVATANEIAAVALAQAEYSRLYAYSTNPKNFDLKTPEGIAALKEAKAAAKSFKDNQLNSALEAESNAQQQFTSQINQLRQTQSNADRQASTAASGTPNTSTNTPPVATTPGNSNTNVTTTDTAQIQNSGVQTSPEYTTDGSGNQYKNGVLFRAAEVTDPNPEDQRQAELQAIGRQDAEAQQIAEKQYINQEPASGGGGAEGVNSSIQQQKQAEADARQDDAAYQASLQQYVESEPPSAGGSSKGLQGAVGLARGQQTIQDAENAKTQGDWRVRLSLAYGANYLYAADNAGILAPLQKTSGIIFPYLPQIQVTYAAHYDPQELIHSNYKIYQYKSSGVDQINLTCDFTAQDTFEANYLLAVIHFFRSVTKMFYGQDQQPSPGTPPPLCYLSGMGDFQFDRHPLLISSFNYSLPNDVDYIRASSPTLASGVNSTGYDNGSMNKDTTPSQVRLNELNPGATVSPPAWQRSATNTQPTYVPTKMQINITAYPIVTRNDISNNFSLKKYATGELLQGSKRPNGGGIW
jgi:hypothetical protein